MKCPGCAAPNDAQTGLGHTDQPSVGDVRVSTVWVGRDPLLRRPPLIFETMVFGGPMDSEMYRYSTEAQALAGHTNTVELVRLVLQVLPSTPLPEGTA